MSSNNIVVQIYNSRMTILELLHSKYHYNIERKKDIYRVHKNRIVKIIISIIWKTKV